MRRVKGTIGPVEKSQDKKRNHKNKEREKKRKEEETKRREEKSENKRTNTQKKKQSLGIVREGLTKRRVTRESRGGMVKERLGGLGSQLQNEEGRTGRRRERCQRAGSRHISS